MVNDRQLLEPRIDFNNFQESTNRMINYSQQTLNIYYKNYYGKVAALRDEFIKRNLKSKELNQFYKFPTNYIGLSQVGSSLSELTEKLYIKIK